MSYLHMFRRKPAITRSDWHFTASLNSSENYATFTRSIHSSLKIKIWSREDHLASGLIEVTYPTLYLVNNNLLNNKVLFYVIIYINNNTQ